MLPSLSHSKKSDWALGLSPRVSQLTSQGAITLSAGIGLDTSLLYRSLSDDVSNPLSATSFGASLGFRRFGFVDAPATYWQTEALFFGYLDVLPVDSGIFLNLKLATGLLLEFFNGLKVSPGYSTIDYVSAKLSPVVGWGISLGVALDELLNLSVDFEHKVIITQSELISYFSAGMSFQVGLKQK